MDAEAAHGVGGGVSAAWGVAEVVGAAWGAAEVSKEADDMAMRGREV
jgi:hypothetical protein